MLMLGESPGSVVTFARHGSRLRQRSVNSPCLFVGCERLRGAKVESKRLAVARSGPMHLGILSSGRIILPRNNYFFATPGCRFLCGSKFYPLLRRAPAATASGTYIPDIYARLESYAQKPHSVQSATWNCKHASQSFLGIRLPMLIQLRCHLSAAQSLHTSSVS